MGKSPKKAASSTPTRSSPRKKAWGSPAKSASKALVSSIFSDADFSPLSNKSWAEITEEDEELNESLRQDREASGRRKPGLPRKMSATKPKFVRSLELSEAIMSSGGRLRRSERVHTTVAVSNDVRESGSSRPNSRAKDNDLKELPDQSASLRAAASRKRHLSTTSTVAEEEEGSPRKRAAPSDSGKPARKNMRNGGTPGRSPARNLLFNSRSTPVSPSTFVKPDFWVDPSLGWCEDQKTLERRSKELAKAKEKPVYARYLKEVPVAKRDRTVHPRTPNKHINYSRRSWDTMVKSWKRSLYDWAGEEPSESVNTSFISEVSDDDAKSEVDNVDLENTPVFANIDIPVRSEPDAMASLLGKFDMDSKCGDDSTLKAPLAAGAVNGPVDFAHLAR